MRSLLCVLACLVLAGCVRTRTVTEYVYVPDVVEVPVFEPDTTHHAVYRSFIRMIESDTNALDTLSTDPGSPLFESDKVRAANYEGTKLRTHIQSIIAYFRSQL